MHRRGQVSMRSDPPPEAAGALSGIPSRSLFHYTTADGLIGILQNQSLFATHSEFLNDSTECKTILAVLLPRLEAELRHVVPELIARKLFQPSILTDYGDEIFRQEAENMLQAMPSATHSTAPYFISSFCIHDPQSPAYEHGLLSQWRGYGRGGFAIEFDEMQLDDLNKAENNSRRYQGIITEEVTYHKHEDRLKEADFAGFAGALLKNLFPSMAHKLEDVLGSKVTNDFARPFLSIAPFLKDPSFEEENEYRIVALCNRPTIKDDADRRAAKQIRFRAKASGQLIPYIALYDGFDAKLPIRSVIVGPNPHQASQKMALEILLEQAGLSDVKIRLSGIPFRE
jgi:hypothetical protein